MRILLIAVMLTLLLVGCIEEPTPAPTPVPTALPQVSGARLPGIPAANLNAGPAVWDPVDPTVPDITEPSGDGRKVKAGWEVASAEYIYRWYKDGPAPLDYQRLTRNGNAYLRDGKIPVSNENVDALVAALDRLYPTQRLLFDHGLDGYSFEWAIELTGVDEQRVLLVSKSGGNPGYGPWNVLYNGRLYAQYDGSIGEALGKIFEGRLSEPMPAASDPSPGLVTFGTQRLLSPPPELEFGYWGLLRLYRRFQYITDDATGMIEGRVLIDRPRQPAQVGDEVKLADSVARINSVKLSPPGRDEVLCRLQEEARYWHFVCMVAVTGGESRYRYPITMEATTRAGEATQLSGELWGVWGAQGSLPLLPPPAEIAAAVPGNLALSDLMKDHMIVGSSYTASLNPDRPLMGERAGDLRLLGTKNVNGRELTYVVNALYSLRDGKFTHWTLDRDWLDAVVSDIGKLPMTARALAADPDTTVEIMHPDPLKEELSPRAGAKNYRVDIPRCWSQPSGTSQTVIRPRATFSFGVSEQTATLQFVLIGDTAAGDLIDVESETSPYCLVCRSMSQKVWEAIMPDALRTGTARPFTALHFEGTGNMHLSPFVRLRQPGDATAEEIRAYEEKVRALPGTADHPEDITGVMTDTWFVTSVAIAVTDEGKLEVRACGN